MKISKIFLYDEPKVPQIKIYRLKCFLEEQFPVKVETRDSILKLIQSDTAEKIAGCRILNPIKPFEKHIPTKEETLFEKLGEQDTTNIKNICMYDGFELQKMLTELIPIEELTMEFFHICFTTRLTGTYDNADYRYHGRALISANPSIISTTGIIEAPAKPREYYIDQMSQFPQNETIEFLKQKYNGMFLEYNDTRLSKIMEGYLLQAIFYYETGEAFCDNKECRLFNAHWQKDLLYSQIESQKICDKHIQILKKLAN